MDVLSDVISSMRIGRPGFARAELRSPWGMRFPPSPGTAGFTVVLRGSCWLLVDGAEPVAVGPSDVIFVPRGDGHGLADDPATPLVEATRPPEPPAGHHADVVTLCGGYRLDPNRTHPLLQDVPAVLHLPAHVGRHDDLRATVGALGRELDKARPGGAALVPLLLDMLLLYVLRAWFEDQPRRPGGTGWAAALADPSISLALHAIHRDPAHGWTVQSLADEAGLSRAAFARRFTAATRQPPLAYLTWWRLTTAASMLRAGDASLEQVASSVGYSSQFALANAFKREYGVAPGRFRRAART
ncbi:AraC family transcriptional regulator [Actinomadura rudentiformis]|uniref:AraC family transcriptional regulator n=1 Tax=Actinomadura rudentiformis TaxID=359158 RepID=A0A6H9YW83_9ACTN|nr:AraC family transcriptional regulator [Actinomadura rudentiformis]KAB2350247.1 AraC family transcriptional regulator [Actinomadura rudentiformis]